MGGRIVAFLATSGIIPMRKIASRCFIAITSLGMNQIDFSEVSAFYKAFDFDSNIELLVYPNRDEKVWNTDEH